MNNQEFKQAYNGLEVRMKDFAERSDEIFVPNIAPRGPVDYIFICMEPSLGEWASNRDEAENKLKAGFRNFLDGYNTMILHYAIRNYLCRDNQSYHITDLSKGAMLVKHVARDRMARYGNWYSLLLKEVELVASTRCIVFCVGALVAKFLKEQKFPRPAIPLIHYSGTAVRHWDSVIQKHRKDFELFRGSVTQKDFLDNANDIIASSGVTSVISERALGRLRRTKLTDSKLKLIFNYKLSFDAVRATIAGAPENRTVC